MWRLENWLYRIRFRLEYKLHGTWLWNILTWFSTVEISNRYVHLFESRFEQYKDSYLGSELFRSDYMRFAKTILRRVFKIRGRTDYLAESLGEGNWQHLWETEEEKQEDASEIFEYMTSDILYCSDRWSWDRFLRINWQFQRIKRRTMQVK